MAAHGITPAWAGKSSLPCSRGCSSKDHPRIGGERRMSSCRVGSPPHRRGKGGSRRIVCAQIGITPAWAGKRNWAIGSRLLNWDHPRVGGEKGSYRWVIKSVKGSPPRGRGKDKAEHLVQHHIGITPAWAGKSSPAACSAPLRTDHPRMGGEKSFSISSTYCATGSPPHGRGKGGPRAHAGRLCGITPAWAGKSPASQPWSPPLWIMVIRPRP